MDPIAFSIPLFGYGPLDIRWYGIMMAASMLIGAFIAAKLLKSIGRDGDLVWDALFWIILFGVIGARVVYVLTNLSAYFGPDTNPWHIFAVWHGGLSFHGGIIAGLIATYFYFNSRSIPFIEVMDAFAPGVSLGVILVRFGNFMNGDILAYKWTGPWAMNFPYDYYHLNEYGLSSEIIPRHPAEIYGMVVGVFCLVLSVVLWNETYRTKRLPIGTAYLGFILCYSLVRSAIEEPFRAVHLPWEVVSPSAAGYGLFTTAQLASAVIIILALWGFTQLRVWERRRMAASKQSVPPRAGVSRQARRAAERGDRKRSK